MKKIVVLNIIALAIIGMFVFFTNQGSITGRAIPSSLAADGEENTEPDILEVCKSKKFESSGLFGCYSYIDGSGWKCELTGKGPVSITKTDGTSMYPTITDDTLVVLMEASFEDLEVCDIVGFEKDKNLLLHRIIEIDNSERCVITKGDNNPYNDGCIKEDQIIGKVAVLLEGADYASKLTANFTDFEA